MNRDWTQILPPMLSGEELKNALAYYPSYDPSICSKGLTERLSGLMSLYDLYQPSVMSEEIYCKLYLATLRSLHKKQTRLATMQLNENRKMLLQSRGNGVIGGADSFTIIGHSGIGKSAAISRAVSLISGNKIIETEDPYAKIIPCLTIQTPFDASVKSTLLEILRVVDEQIKTRYLENALRVRATTDQLIGVVSTVALNHFALLIVDEVQNMVNSKNGKALIGALVQIINSAGISICLVGIPQSCIMFEEAFHLARRSLGLEYGCLPYDDFFRKLCKKLFDYCYIQTKPELSESMAAWLYEHSGGITSSVVSLVHDAQELAILSGTERLDLAMLNKAYEERMKMLHGFIEPGIHRSSSTSRVGKSPFSVPEQDEALSDCPNLLSAIRKQAKETDSDVVAILKKYITIREIKTP